MTKGLVINYGEGGGYKTGGGGHVKFWGSFSAVALSFSHIEGGPENFPLFKRGGARKVLPCLEGGGGGAQKVLDPRFSHFVAPPPRN